MKKDYCFRTVCSSNYNSYLEKMRKSFEYFNPGEELIVFGDKEVEEGRKFGYDFGTFYAWHNEILLKEYKTIIHIDVDNLITDNILDILGGDYDIAAPLNNNTWHHAETGEVPQNIYLSAGLHVVKSARFNYLWYCLSKYYAKQNYFVENDTMDQAAFWGGFKVRSLGAEPGDPFWGTELADKWEEIELINDRLYCQGRKVKMIHWAGGNIIKLNYRDYHFKPEVKDWLDKICL